MARKKGFGVSPLTNTIFYGTQDTEKNMFVGKKEDVTDGVIASVFEWFMNNFKGKEPCEVFEIRYEGVPYVLQMIKEKE